MDKNQNEIWIKKWSRSKAGKCYYFNTKTGVSTWVCPEGFIEQEPTNESKEPGMKELDSGSSISKRKRKLPKSDGESNFLSKKSSLSRPLSGEHETEKCLKPSQLKDGVIVKEKKQEWKTQEDDKKQSTSHAHSQTNKRNSLEGNLQNSKVFKGTKKKRKPKKRKNTVASSVKEALPIDARNTCVASTTVKTSSSLGNEMKIHTSETTITDNALPTKSTISATCTSQYTLKIDNVLSNTPISIDKNYIESGSAAKNKTYASAKACQDASHSADVLRNGPISEEIVSKSPIVSKIVHNQSPAQTRLKRLQSKLHGLKPTDNKVQLPSTVQATPPKPSLLALVVASKNVDGSISEKLPISDYVNVKNKNLVEPAKETAEMRLKRLQESLKSKLPLKELSQIGREDTIVSKPSAKLEYYQAGSSKSGLAETRLAKLQSKISLNNNNYNNNNNNDDDNDCEAMEVEYMESEVLSDIGELRQKDIGVEFQYQPIFMDVDMTVDSPTSIPDPQTSLFIALDTNILLSHLQFAKGLRDQTIKGRGPVKLFLPWQVLHELDHLKDKGKGSVQPLARRAINYLHDNFSSQHPRVRGQAMNDARVNSSSNPDDNILQACLQMRDKGHDVVLLSNDINLLNKALVSGVSAVSKDQFEKQICGDAESKSVNHTALSKNPELNLLEEKDLTPETCLNDVILCAFIATMKKTLTEVVSQGMKEEYKYLWKKRTLIPPPWEVDQVLQCLCHHWLPVCGDFIPPSLKQSIEKLRDFFKVKTERYGVSGFDIKESLGLTVTLFEALPEKYNCTVTSAIQELKDLKRKLEGNYKKSFEMKRDESALATNKNLLVLCCFEEAHNAVERLCRSQFLLEPDWLEKAQPMLVAVHSLIQLLKLLLSKPADFLDEEDPVIIELTNLIKGTKQITPKDVVNFCKEASNRILMENGILQFNSFETELSNMAAKISGGL